MKSIARVLFGLLFTLLIASHDATCADAKTNPAAADDLFSDPKVLQLKIEIPAANLEALKKAPKTYVKATVREGDKVYADAGIRLKGNAKSEALEKKPGLTIKFNEFASGSHFHGHSRILLDNALHDPSFLSAAIGGEVFRAADVPAPKITFARVELNGRDVGLYVVEQAANREFLSEFFNKTKGNLYEGAHSDITDQLEKDGGDSSKDQPDLKKLAAAAREPDLAQRLKKLGPLVDLDRFVSFAAVEVLTWDRSGYSMSQNNYRIYHDPGNGRMVFIPHSLDQLFAKADGPLVPPWKGILANAILQTPEGQRRYRERMTSLLDTVCKVEKLQARLNELAGKIRPALSVNAAELKSFEAGVASLRDRIAKRAYFIGEELKKTH